jgi:hypothetical protein
MMATWVRPLGYLGRSAAVLLAASGIALVASVLVVNPPNASDVSSPGHAPPLSLGTVLFALTRQLILIGGAAIIGRKVLRLQL